MVYCLMIRERALIDFLKTYGEFLVKTGRIEMESGESIDVLIREALDPNNFLKNIQSLPKEYVVEILQIFNSLAEIGRSRFEHMDHRDKIRVGEELIAISDKLRRILEMREGLEKGG